MSDWKERVKFTKHALRKMMRREVKKEEVVDAIRYADRILYDLRSACFISIRKIDDKFLLVAYKFSNENIMVITTFKTSKGEHLILKRKRRGIWIELE